MDVTPAATGAGSPPSATTGGGGRPGNGRLVVLHSLRRPDGTTKYVDHMVGAAGQGVELRYFSWVTALVGRYDVLHVHWPELLLRDSRRPWLRVVRRRLLDLLLVRLRLQRIPLVWTAHNLSPHEAGSRAEQRSLRRFTRAIDMVVRLNGVSRVEAGRDQATVLHGHYREPFAAHPQPEATPGRLLYFGIIRAYKGVDDLMAAFGELDSPDLCLRIVGDPHPGWADRVQAAEQADPRISALLRFVDDSELVEEIRRAQLVVLPYRGGMHNSGAALAALSLDRPVLVPESPTNAALADEVGAGWVLQYAGELTADVLEKALVATREMPGDPPNLDARDWDEVGRGLRGAYARARALRGRG